MRDDTDGDEQFAETAMAYVTILVREDEVYSSPAIHPHGQIFRKNILAGLRKGICQCAVFSARPEVAFPRGNRLYIKGTPFTLEDGTLVESVPYVNVTPIKQLTIGMSMLGRLLHWGWQKRHERYRLIVSFNLSVPPAFFTLLAARLVRAKAIVHVSDVSLPGVTVPNTLWYKIDAWIQHRILPHFDGHIVVADRIATDFLPGKRCVRMEGGVSSSLVENTGRLLANRPPKPPATFTIAATGGLESHNGFVEILEAFSQLKGEQYRMSIAGRGSLQSLVENAAHQDRRITYHGYLNQDELLQLHANSDLLINMRITNRLNTGYAFPSKTLEYLVSGVPLLTTCTGHIEDELAEYCYLLKDESAVGLASRITEIAGHSRVQREALGQRARDFMSTYKSWDSQCARILDYLRQHILVERGSEWHRR